MLSAVGNLSILLSIILSFLLVFFSIRELKESKVHTSLKIRNFSLLQLLFTNLSFIVLLLGYLFSDFSLINVYENSHTTKPMLYKVSGVW